MTISTKLVTDHWRYNLTQFTHKLRYLCTDALGFNPGKVLHDLIVSAVAQNSTEGEFLAEAYRVFADQLNQQDLGSDLAALALKRFSEQPEVEAALEQLQASIVQAFHASTYESLRIAYSPDTLLTNTVDWVNDEYAPVDERTLANNARKIRRMDSLARLLSLRSSLSACTAVAFDISDVPMLVIGVNVSKRDTQDSIIQAISAKLTIVQHFLIQLTAEKPTFSKALIEDYSSALAQALLSQEAGSFPFDILKQAAKKVIDAVCFDDDTFTTVEKDLLLLNTSTVILAPHIDTHQATMQVRELSEAPHESMIALPMIPAGIGVKDLHAEQLIAHYLFSVLQKTYAQPLDIGCSKLCCQVCFDNLSQYPVSIRGHHGQRYQNVVNLINGERPTVISQRRATTHAWPSPEDTPDQRETRMKKTIDLSTEKKGKRQLIMDIDEPCSGSTSTMHDSDQLAGAENREEPSSKPNTSNRQHHFFHTEQGVLQRVDINTNPPQLDEMPLSLNGAGK